MPLGKLIDTNFNSKWTIPLTNQNPRQANVLRQRHNWRQMLIFSRQVWHPKPNVS